MFGLGQGIVKWEKLFFSLRYLGRGGGGVCVGGGWGGGGGGVTETD